MELAVWLAALLGSGYFLCRILTCFLTHRPILLWKGVLLATLGISSHMIIWIGDPNLLYTFPLLFVVLLPGDRGGDRVGRVAVALIFLLPDHVGLRPAGHLSLCTQTRLPCPDMSRTAVFRAAVPSAPPPAAPGSRLALPRRLWKLILALAMMPLCALVAVVLLSSRVWISQEAHVMGLTQGLVVLPFTLATAVALLFVILALADHEGLEQAVRLAGLREVYYQGLQREHQQLRTLRHDLRNHVTALQGLLAQGEGRRAQAYLDQLVRSPALSAQRRFCDNETANVVLSAKAKEMEGRGLRGIFQVALPARLLLSDADLCALLGNALDNAMEAAEKSEDPVIHLRCRVEKGLFMLQVENALAGDKAPDLATTKEDKAAHGFGLPGMREIARRYGGSLEVTAAQGRFLLTACLPQ